LKCRDLISGGTGNNTLSGGSGNNTFEFSMLDLDDPDTVTTITDFNVNKDSLSFKDVFDDNGNNTGELDDIDANIQSISNVNTDSLEITMNSGAQIIIENFGAIDPGVNGLGDLPSLDVQVDVI
jgi:Ca2+-binding RTX toxin-like protein